MFLVIVRVRVVLRKTVVSDWCFDYLSSSHLQSQMKSHDQYSCLWLWFGICQYCRDVLVLLLFSDDHTKCITDTPRLKPFTIIPIISSCSMFICQSTDMLVTISMTSEGDKSIGTQLSCVPVCRYSYKRCEIVQTFSWQQQNWQKVIRIVMSFKNNVQMDGVPTSPSKKTNKQTKKILHHVVVCLEPSGSL